MVHSLRADQADHRQLLEHLFASAVAHCAAAAVLPKHLPGTAPRGKNLVLGAGKAAAEMAAVAHAHLPGPTEGLVVTRYGHGTTLPTGQIEVLEASHPVPDKRSAEGAQRMLDMARAASPDDRVIFLFSGGGSALLCAPIDGLSMECKRATTQALLHSGAPIEAINLVRKHLSCIKGGQLASQVPEGAELCTYLISDVAGDNAGDIASGPSIPTDPDPEAALAVLEAYGCAPEPALADAIRQARRSRAPEHPVVVVARAQTALDAVKRDLDADGWPVVVLGDKVEGEATCIGREHGELALKYQREGKTVALISGGELVVQVDNATGRGGPNLEYLTSLMLTLDGAAGIEAIACDSDGIDGSEDNAGGYIGPDSLRRSSAAGLDPRALLKGNDTYTCFETLGDLIITGPTRTNVNDIRIILIHSARKDSGFAQRP